MSKDYLNDYDNQIQGTVSDCAAGLNISTGALYIALKNSPHQIEPVGTFRTEGAKGRGSKIYNYEDIEEMYNQYLDSRGNNASGDYVDEYDTNTHCTLDEYAEREDVEYSKSQLYIMVKQQELAPAFKYRPSGRGRGSNVYVVSELAEAVSSYLEHKATQYPSEYDNTQYVTMTDALNMFPTDWEVNQAMISPFMRLFNITPDHQVKTGSTARSRPTNVYSKAAVQAAIDVLNNIR